MEKKCLVSVVIPVKNGGEFLNEVLESMLSQKTTFLYEVIVIDSGSKDNSLDIIREHKVKLIQIPSHEFNHGLTRNLGVRKSQGDFIAFLTQDATPLDDKWLENLVSPLLEDSDIAGVFGKHMARTKCDPIIAINLKKFFDVDISQVRKCWKKDDGYNSNRGLYVFFSNNNSCIRKQVWEEIPFREVEMSEDQLWAQDILENGYVKCYEPSAVVYHSHMYSPKEWFQRQFDEYRAYRKMGLVQKIGLRHLFVNFCGSSVSDIIKLANSPTLSLEEKIYWSFQRILNNFGGSVGKFFGTKYDTIPESTAKKFMSQQSRNMK